MSLSSEIEVEIKVDCSFDKKVGVNIYRFWDINMSIPKPPNVKYAFIYINGVMEQMRFNKVWGQKFDPDGEGTWLKQKKTRGFEVATGIQKYRVQWFVE